MRFSSTLLNDKRNLLLDENYELHNRAMHISRMLEEVDIESAKVDIECAKVNIENQLKAFSDSISEKTEYSVLRVPLIRDRIPSVAQSVPLTY